MEIENDIHFLKPVEWQDLKLKVTDNNDNFAVGLKISHFVEGLLLDQIIFYGSLNYIRKNVTTMYLNDLRLLTE